MYKVVAIYKSHDGCKFDYDHYWSTHVPLATKQMKAGNVPFSRREVETEFKGFLDPSTPVPMLTCTYYVDSEAEIDNFRQFMMTDLVQPLIEDAQKYTDCEIDWVVSKVTVG